MVLNCIIRNEPASFSSRLCVLASSRPMLVMINDEWKEPGVGKVLWQGLGFFFLFYFSMAMEYGGVCALGIRIPKAGGEEFVSSPSGQKWGFRVLSYSDGSLGTGLGTVGDGLAWA